LIFETQVKSSHHIDTLAGEHSSRLYYIFLIEQQALPYAFRVP
jgi:hypothetical protein